MSIKTFVSWRGRVGGGGGISEHFLTNKRNKMNFILPHSFSLNSDNIVKANSLSHFALCDI